MRVSKAEAGSRGNQILGNGKRGLENRKPSAGEEQWHGEKREPRESLKHLTVKDFVLLLTWGTCATDTADHQKGSPDCDQNGGPIRLEPLCELVKMKRMHLSTPHLMKLILRGKVFRDAK
jgi:hypothetical protein